MNLKEAFRFQNKLQSMMDEAQSILGSTANITKVQNTYLRKKVIPYAVVDLESRETICRFNQKNVKASDFDIRMLSRTLYESARKFYEDPENVKAFEKWKREQNQKKGKAPRK